LSLLLPTNPIVANVLQYISCEFLLLLLVYLLNVAGFSTVAASLLMLASLLLLA
jgi:hypothetical protein